MYSLQMSKPVIKFVNSRTPKERQRIKAAFESLQNNPFQNQLDIKKMKGMANHYRLRIGDYRFLYEILHEQVLIYLYKADNRGDVYK